ncbi:Hypothetical predicted protein [Lecanosticta acicola]|uniref:DUF1754-domain-containing protein n=1 Tax=Lecanosticta acicola TaxID=111012 RepID=A0AAI8Z7K2_9PEZI|nr:Hypothetical predicted protein [Lecanosticta acicola]
MPSSDYSNAVGGGLKLKGASSGGIEKTKKKKAKKAVVRADSGEETKKEQQQVEDGDGDLQKALADEEEVDETRDARDAEEVKEYGKTEAQRRFEERRKKRLDERLKREGVRTHKERVQQLNKYLSTLSEHNDMPRIGPG